MDNEVIVIGGSHYNTLGVIRSLGEVNIKVYAIITNKNKYAYIKKSKYLKNYDIIEENEEEIKKILLSKYSNHNKAVLIPTSDFAALFIDKNLNELKNYFVVPNIDNKQGKMEELMNKYNQFNLAKKNNIKIAETFELDLNKIDEDKITYPNILKPITSAYGKKMDIVICENKKEFKEKVDVLRNKGYEKILFQELIDFDYECGITGCSYNGTIIIPGIIKKERIYPPKRGSTCYAKYVQDNNIQSIVKMLKSLKYNGFFDIEFFVKNKNIYLNEINFRTGAYHYASNYGNVNIVYLYLLLINNKNILNKKIEKEYYFQEDIADLKLVFKRKISLLDYIKSFKKAKVHLTLNKHDMKPFFYKILYIILHK